MTLSNSPDARARAGVRWASLGNRLRTISPEALTKGAIAALIVGTATALSVATWPSLAPFLVGVVIAYAVLPIANRLDTFMPRVIAALLAELVAVAILVGVLLIVVPPILNGLVEVALRLPSGEALRAQLVDLQAQLGELPEPARTVVLAVATESATNLQAAINGFVDSAASIVSSQILGVFNTLSFVLGLLVIPAWILTIVADEREIKRRAGSLLPVAMRRDAAAIVTIIDRAFGTFLRHRVLLAIVSGLLVWGGLELTNAIGLTQIRYTATAGTLLGFLQLIPELGFFLGIFPILLFIPVSGPVVALTAFVVYWISVKVADGLVRRAGLEGRARRAPRGAPAGDRRAQPVRHRLAGGGGTGDRDHPRPRPLRLRAAVRPADARRRRARAPGAPPWSRLDPRRPRRSTAAWQHDRPAPAAAPRRRRFRPSRHRRWFGRPPGRHP